MPSVDTLVLYRTHVWPRSHILALCWQWQEILIILGVRWRAHVNWLSRSSRNVAMRFAVWIGSLVVRGLAVKGRRHRMLPVPRLAGQGLHEQ